MPCEGLVLQPIFTEHLLYPTLLQLLARPTGPSSPLATGRVVDLGASATSLFPRVIPHTLIAHFLLGAVTLDLFIWSFWVLFA